LTPAGSNYTSDDTGERAFLYIGNPVSGGTMATASSATARGDLLVRLIPQLLPTPATSRCRTSAELARVSTEHS
jgi:hypothetical protein